MDGSVRVEGDDRAVAIGREASDQGQAGEATIGSKSSDESPHEAARQAGSPDAASLSRAAPPAERSAPCRSRALWALLLARIYEVLPLLCPACRGEMKILAFLTDPPTVRAILLHLDLPHRPPPVTPARGPPQSEFALDQSPDFDVSEPEPVPDFDFDQSVPEEPESEWSESDGDFEPTE